MTQPKTKPVVISVRPNTLARRTQDEHRRVSRYDLRMAVTVELADGTRINATSKNLGVGGMFVEMPNPPPFETRVAIRIPLPGLPTPTRIPAVVRWTDAEGMGVQFGLMGARETHALVTLLRG